MVRNGRDTAMGSPRDGPPATRAVVRVLGGFTATVGDDAVNLGGPRQRGVLARILVGGAEAVSAEQLLHDVWGERAVEATVGAVQAYVSRLRRLFGPDALPRQRRRLRPGPRRWSPSTPTCSYPTSTRGGARWPAATTKTRRRCSRPPWPAGPGRARSGRARRPQMSFLAPVAARLEEQRVVAAEALADAHARQGRAADDVALLEEPRGP